MKSLKHPLPPNRTLEQVWNHYQVEAALAKRLKAADREGRQRIFATMYDELFAAVPDHPRLTYRASVRHTEKSNRSKLAALRPWMAKDAIVLEFAPGDSEFAAAIAPRVRKIIGVDISDQRRPDRRWPPNFEHVVYDGYQLPQVAPGSVDLAFSDQLLEHLHPEDAASHLLLCHSLLKPGGCYVIRTPHAFSGPWDVSRYFCDDPDGFHLKEWTFRDLRVSLLEAGFSRFEAAWNARETNVRLPYAYFTSAESVLGMFSRSFNRKVARLFAPYVLCAAFK